MTEMYEELIGELHIVESGVQSKRRRELLEKAAVAIEKLAKDLERSKEYETSWNKEAEEALRRFQVAVANKPCWIPVTERLPDGDGKYLCIVRSFSQYHNKQYRFVDILVFQDGCFFECGIGTERVTHWQPLPEPPKEET